MYGVVCDEIKKGITIDKNNQTINVSDVDRVRGIYRNICNLENTYKIMSYLYDTLIMLKQAIDGNESGSVKFL